MNSGLQSGNTNFLSFVSASASPAWIPYSVWQHLFSSNFICSKYTCDSSCHWNRNSKTLPLPGWQCSHTVSFHNVLNNQWVSLLHRFPIKLFLFVGHFNRWPRDSVLYLFVTFCLILPSSSGPVRSMTAYRTTGSFSYIFSQIYHIYPDIMCMFELCNTKTWGCITVSHLFLLLF